MINAETNYWWFAFYQDQLLLERDNNASSVLMGENTLVAILRGTTIYAISTAMGMVCKAFYTDSPIVETPEYVQVGLRVSYDYLSQEYYQAASKVHEILHWDRSNRYCPTCGTPLIQKGPIVKKCPNCGREIYPVISATILILVRKENSLLPVYARNFKGAFNSLVAGLLRTDETLEECVVREVGEETGFDVRNIRYFGNQPWPRPSGLMVGFITDYAGGDIHLQDGGLSSGNFYTRDYLPELPRRLSLIRKVIDWWIVQ